MSTMIIITKVTQNYLMNKTKHELTRMILDLMDKDENWKEELAKANSLLRSAFAIAIRNGKDTNWEAFEFQLNKTLEEERIILEGYWETESKEVLSTFYNETWICPRCGHVNSVQNVNGDYVNECDSCHMPILGSTV